MFNLAIFGCGLVLGAVANWAIYQWGYFRVRSIGPWTPAIPEAPTRRWWDYLPVLGWWTLRRESPWHGGGFWIRPLLVELACGGFAVYFWHWQMAGGLVSNRLALPASQAETWLAAHGLLIFLLLIATFIDFDEQTIPDKVTLPGTWSALLFSWLLPEFRLPVLAQGPSQIPLTPYSPDEFPSPAWWDDGRGLLFGWVIVGIWCWALMPKLTTLRWGWWQGLRLCWASVWRPRRRRTCDIRVRQRYPEGATLWLVVMGAVAGLGWTAAWYLSGPSFQSLVGSVCGMAVGGGLIWAIRVIASQAVGQEAMGFGDVTLMIMVGAFLGWQPAVLIIVFAPFAALGIAVVQFLLTSNRALAFGPYLAAATLFLLLRWPALWNEYEILFAWKLMFFVGTAILLVMLGVLMYGMSFTRRGEEE